MKVEDLRKKTTQELNEMLMKEEKDFVDKKMLYTTGKNKDNTVFVNMKKNIARIKTVIREKEILNESKNI